MPMITITATTDVTDPRFQIALSRVCPVCGAERGHLCGDDTGEEVGVHKGRVEMHDTFAQQLAAQAVTTPRSLELRVAELESAVRYLMRRDGENIRLERTADNDTGEG